MQKEKCMVSGGTRTSYLSMVVIMRPPPDATCASHPLPSRDLRSFCSCAMNLTEVPSSVSRPSVSVCTLIRFTPRSAACK